MSGPLVLKTLAGLKRQTRRIVQWPVLGPAIGGKRRLFTSDDVEKHHDEIAKLSRFGRSGDRLWVKETFATVFDCPALPCACEEGGTEHRRVVYRASEPDGIANYCRAFDDERPALWKPSIFMRRHESRLTLAVESVRVERLQDISEEDARAEGGDPALAALGNNGYRPWFAALWDSINGERASWASNPFVWVVAFSVAEPRP